MRASKKVTFYLFLFVLGLIGFSGRQIMAFHHGSLPEEIYVTPQEKYDKVLKVGLFSFIDPYNAQGLGRASAECLYRELLKNRVFSDLTLEIGTANIPFKSVADITANQEYDLIITGNFRHYFEGGNFEHSHVEEEMRVIRVIDNKIETLWHARAVEIGLPTPYKDYIFVQKDGSPAPSAMALIKRNAKKFSNLLLTESPDR
jgi:hypothetical protein